MPYNNKILYYWLLFRLRGNYMMFKVVKQGNWQLYGKLCAFLWAVLLHHRLGVVTSGGEGAPIRVVPKTHALTCHTSDAITSTELKKKPWQSYGFVPVFFSCLSDMTSLQVILVVTGGWLCPNTIPLKGSGSHITQLIW